IEQNLESGRFRVVAARERYYPLPHEEVPEGTIRRKRYVELSICGACLNRQWRVRLTVKPNHPALIEEVRMANATLDEFVETLGWKESFIVEAPDPGAGWNLPAAA